MGALATMWLATALCQELDSPLPAEKEAKSPQTAEAQEKVKPKAETDAKAIADSPYFKSKDNEIPTAYVIRPGDKVEIKVTGEEDLTATKTVDGSGYVNLDLVERVEIGGLTVEAAENLIESDYGKDFLIEPNVSLTVIEKAQRKFVILGQVRSPGYYSVPRSLKVDVLQAIAIAGGYTRIAGNVLIKRTTSTGEVKRKFSLRRLRKGARSDIPIVAEDDTIIVGESLF